MMTFFGPSDARSSSSNVHLNLRSISGETSAPGCDGSVWKSGPQSVTTGSARPRASPVPGSGVANCTAGNAPKRLKRSKAKASVVLTSSAVSPGRPMMKWIISGTPAACALSAAWTIVARSSCLPTTSVTTRCDAALRAHAHGGDPAAHRLEMLAASR